jgi:hypothetical protein
MLRWSLDPNRNDGNAKFLGQRNDRSRDRYILVIGRDARHEMLVDLQGVDGDLLEVNEARPADAEVVYGYANFELLKAAKEVSGLFDVFDQSGLGHLEPQRARVQTAR